MSMNLKWEPVRPANGKSLAYGVKRIFEKRVFNGPIELGPDDLDFIRGAQAASDGADTKEDLGVLIEAIEKYGGVRLWLE